ncbi:UDP-glucose 4-epimerase [Candidatus Magnetobacterium bavaricum]|uniref:UDP-glucose 4-epimerase n=1 Tax=Candidatus Magnetobacterium bavaricum TaxID=29290 RepID=A0A0F3GJP2_9BACT|nr:UDP-glucose 4-epimerase [Candidatus Magnetobacterium bavaricum]
MVVLITGINGFIGRHLSRILIERDYVVQGTMRSHVELISDVSKIHITEDIGPTVNWKPILKNIDVIIHLAAHVHVMKQTSNNTAYRHVNTLGTEHLARAAAAAGVKRMIYLSTIKVNGEETIHTPFVEDSPTSAEDPYALSKLEAERSLFQIASQTGLEVVILRPPLVYGAYVKGNFYKLLKLLHTGLVLPVASTKNKRSLVYVGNLVDAIINCIMHSTAANKIYLISDCEDLSTPELAIRLSAALGKPARVIAVPTALLHLLGTVTGRLNTIKRLINSLTVDCSKIRSELDWTPPFTVNQGLKDTADWFINDHNS